MPEFFDEQPAEPEQLPVAPPRTDVTPTDRAMPISPGLPSGTGIGKYRILERIRTYHNAVVYKARDGMLDRLVAIKQMSPDLIDNPIACGNFKREAQLLARIPKDARNIINIHELIEDKIGLFIVEEFVVGHWLESLLFKRHVDQRHAYKLLKTAAWGLKTLHSHSIVHRDIQPGNIMVTKNGSAKIANLASAAHEGDLGGPPVITPKYTAPELLLERKYDDRVDIYGLGFALYEVCVGRQAMDRFFGDIGEGIAAVGHWTGWHTNFDARLPDATVLNPLVAAPMAAILRQMTAKSLDERFTSIDEVLDALSRYFLADASKGPRILRSPIRLPDVTPETWKSNNLFPALYAVAPWAETQGPTQRTVAGATRTQSIGVPGRSADEVEQWDLEQKREAERAIDLRSKYGSSRLSPNLRRRRSPDRVLPHPVLITAIPIPPKAVEKHKKHTPRAVRWSLMALLYLCIASGGVLAWLYGGPLLRGSRPMELILRDAQAAYDNGQMETAKTKFLEAKERSSNNKDFQTLENQADFWLEMVAAQQALAHDEFGEVKRLLQRAELRGINPAKVEALQQLAWTRQDAARLAEMGMSELAKGNVQTVEVELDQYEKKATEAGLDPTQLKDGVEQTKKNLKYEESMKRAVAALQQEDFQEALALLGNAEGIRMTTATRELHQRINNASQRKELVTRGDQAMTDKDYVTAEAAYVQAIQLYASSDVEQKSRSARSFILIDEAREAIKQGALLVAEQKLKSSLWNTYTADAKGLLDGMAPAFDVARIVRRGDQALDREEFDEATRLYNEAIPKLPVPANTIAKQKIVEVQRARLIKEGDLAVKRNDRQKALECYAAAQHLRAGSDIDSRIEAAKSPTTRSSSQPVMNEPLETDIGDDMPEVSPSQQILPSAP